MKSRAVKKKDLDILKEEFAASDSAFLVEFQGLTVSAADELRSKMRGAQASYRVVKNTLARSASQGTGLEPLADQFTGPTAVALPREDTPGVAKILVEFAKVHPALRIKAGIIEGATLDAAQCKDIAEIPSREELQAKLAFVLQSPLQRLATVLNAPMRDLAVVLGAVGQKKEEG